jgi:hypothetical protein
MAFSEWRIVGVRFVLSPTRIAQLSISWYTLSIMTRPLGPGNPAEDA